MHEQIYWERGEATMTTRPERGRPHLATSPFKRPIERSIDQFAVDERVTHDVYGLGRVIGTEAAAVTVDFGTRQIRLTSPYRKLRKL
jgi:hypothetical protein